MREEDRCPNCMDPSLGAFVFDQGIGPGEVLTCPHCGVEILVESEESDGFTSWWNFVEADDA